MDKKPALTFFLGACLGSGITWYLSHEKAPVAAQNSTAPMTTAGPSNGASVTPAPVGQEISLGERSGNVIDNSERGNDEEINDEGRTQMESYERSIASEGEAPQMEDLSALAPEETESPREDTDDTAND